MIVNLLFRFFWILSISNATQGMMPNIFISLPRGYANFILCMIEMIRRIIWNQIRVEYEHTKNCGKLNAVCELDYKNII